MCQTLRWALVLTAIAAQAVAQDAESQSRGMVFYERFQGSANSIGFVSRLDTTAGYNLNSHFTVLGGVPIYFVRPSSDTTATTGAHVAA
jgi:hypothetical protein